MSNSIVPQVEGLYNQIAARIDSGSPFASPAGAWQGFEEIARIGVHTIGLHFVKNLLSLQADNGLLLYPRLPIARRIAKGQYESMLDRAGFDNWVKGWLPELPHTNGASAPPPDPGFDLVIASRKNGYGSTSNAAAPILWWKLKGQPKEEPRASVALTDSIIQNRLADYELVDTETRHNMIVRRYRKLSPQRKMPAGWYGATDEEIAAAEALAAARQDAAKVG